MAVRFIEMGKKPVLPGVFIRDLHPMLELSKSGNLYPTLHKMMAITKNHNFKEPIHVKRYIYASRDDKISPDFLMETLRAIKTGLPALEAENKKISWFDIDALKVLTSRVYHTQKDEDEEERTRWAVHNEIRGTLFNENLSPRDRINVLVNLGIIGIEDNRQMDLIQHGPRIPHSKEKEYLTADEMRRMREGIESQRTFFDIPGFKGPINKK